MSCEVRLLPPKTGGRVDLLLVVHYCQMDADDEVIHYDGLVDDEGSPHGRGTAYLQSGGIFRGHFEHGLPQGRGCTELPDGSTQRGNYVAGELEGRGVYEFPCGDTMSFHYRSGVMHGAFEERAPDGSLRCRGTMQEDVRCGAIEFHFVDGGQLHGNVNDDGQVSGAGFCYTYPDGLSRLRGQWVNEEMKCATFETDLTIQDQEAQVIRSGRETLNETELAQLLPPSGVTFCHDPGQPVQPSSRPLLRDPYEAWRVEVRSSAIGGRVGEGLFARRAITDGEVVCFYSGVRCAHEDVDNRSWIENDNTLSVDAETVIDIPDEWITTRTYCASLGHKANHSFTPNARYEPCTHPRFGEIKCIRANQAIAPGEEVTVHYDYNTINPSNGELVAPEWYQKLHAARGDVEPTQVYRVYRGLVWI